MEHYATSVLSFKTSSGRLVKPPRLPVVARVGLSAGFGKLHHLASADFKN